VGELLAETTGDAQVRALRLIEAEDLVAELTGKLDNYVRLVMEHQRWQVWAQRRIADLEGQNSSERELAAALESNGRGRGESYSAVSTLTHAERFAEEIRVGAQADARSVLTNAGELARFIIARATDEAMEIRSNAISGIRDEIAALEVTRNARHAEVEALLVRLDTVRGGARSVLIDALGELGGRDYGVAERAGSSPSGVLCGADEVNHISSDQ
jgi:hypothetical protein